MKTIFTMLYSPAGGTMHLCASAVHRDKEESLWQCDHKIVTNQLQQEQFLQIADTVFRMLFSDKKNYKKTEQKKKAQMNLENCRSFRLW